MRTLTLLCLASLSVFAQAPWQNPVKKLLKEGKPVIGATISIPSPEVAAQVATMGFDFLWIEMEHSPITLETARNMILATRGLQAMPFIRVPVNELWTAKRALDAGAIGVVFPFTSTPELARQAVAACKYPPAGRSLDGNVHSVGMLALSVRCHPARFVAEVESLKISIQSGASPSAS